MQQHSMNPATPEPAPIKTRRWNVSLVWIVPIVALLIGASLVVRNWMQEGPTVTITFKTGEGLVANKTEVRYRNLVIGKVTTIELAEDKRSVKVTASLSKEAESFARADSQFWVVRPRIGAGGVTGLDTLLSGSFIGADAGQSTQRADSFVGLESPPPITYGEEGKSFFLSAPELGSLDIGSPIYYRKIQVGQVISYALDADGKGVTIGVFIRAPNDAYVTADSRFWNASGIDVSVDAKGIRVDTASLASVLAGGWLSALRSSCPVSNRPRQGIASRCLPTKRAHWHRLQVRRGTFACGSISHCAGWRSTHRSNSWASSSARS